MSKCKSNAKRDLIQVCKSNAKLAQVRRREIERLRRALSDLLEYTGGSDLVASNPHHPIAKAFKALGWGGGGQDAVGGKM
jgi:hypothetical protein